MTPRAWWTVFGVAVAGLVGFGLYESRKAAAAPTPVFGGPGFAVVLTPGTMTGISMSLASGPQLALQAPGALPANTGNGTITSGSSSNTSVLAGSAGTWTAKTVGSATLTVQWSDTVGNAYSSTLPVTVTA